MALRLYNTLSGKIEEFHPLQGNEVRMYACGPTVYDYGHIGNFRTFVAVDILRRFLLQSGFSVRHVMNITDVDDKIIRNSAQAGLSVKQYTAKYEKAFLEDSATLNIEQPILARATDHIPEMARFVAELEKKGFAYRADDGSYYFRIAKFPGYGKLSKKDFAGMEDGARVDVDEYEKDSARDFALWKAPKPGEAYWESPIGHGRPGWHIECSAMSMATLLEPFGGGLSCDDPNRNIFDIHGGGIDLVFPHHENEIAQSCCAFHSSRMANFWMHNGFLQVEGRKMAKSEGNFVTIRELLADWPGEVLRLNMLRTHYRQPIDWTMAGVLESQKVLDHWYDIVADIPMPIGVDADDEVVGSLCDDLNTPGALTQLHALAGEIRSCASPLHQLELKNKLKASGAFLGVLAFTKGEALEQHPHRPVVDADQVNALIDARNAARKAKSFKEADRIRDELKAMGIELEDHKDGTTTWKVKR